MANYSERAVTLTYSVVSRYLGLHEMQDNAHSHKSRQTMSGFESRGITSVEWPPLSPNRNLIETV